jgi:hypothetical protein
VVLGTEALQMRVLDLLVLFMVEINTAELALKPEVHLVLLHQDHSLMMITQDQTEAAHSVEKLDLMAVVLPLEVRVPIHHLVELMKAILAVLIPDLLAQVGPMTADLVEGHMTVALAAVLMTVVQDLLVLIVLLALVVLAVEAQEEALHLEALAVVVHLADHLVVVQEAAAANNKFN